MIKNFMFILKRTGYFEAKKPSLNPKKTSAKKLKYHVVVLQNIYYLSGLGPPIYYVLEITFIQIMQGDIMNAKLKAHAVSNYNKKKVGDEKGLPVITCSVCGKEILLVPNVKLMSEAIDAHVENHRQKMKDAKADEKDLERIRDDLIAQVLEKASKS